MVIGFWVPEPVRAREGTRLRFEPALVRVDGAVERRLTDIPEITLEDEEGEDLGWQLTAHSSSAVRNEAGL